MLISNMNTYTWIIYILWCCVTAILEQHYLGISWQFWVIYFPSCWLMLTLLKVNTAHIRKEK